MTKLIVAFRDFANAPKEKETSCKRKYISSCKFKDLFDIRSLLSTVVNHSGLLRYAAVSLGEVSGRFGGSCHRIPGLSVRHFVDHL